MAIFVIERRGGSYGEVSVNWELRTVEGNRVAANGVTGSDRVYPVGGAVVFLQGQNETEISVAVTSDNTRPEVAQRYCVHLLSDTVKGNCIVRCVTQQKPTSIFLRKKVVFLGIEKFVV